MTNRDAANRAIPQHEAGQGEGLSSTLLETVTVYQACNLFEIA